MNETPDSGIEWGVFGLVVADPDCTVSDPTSSRRHDRATANFHRNLVDALLAMVPLSIAEMRSWSEARIEHARHACADAIAAHGDDLQFGGRQRGQALAGLAQAFALGARAHGGISALGVHACTRSHVGCPGLARLAGSDDAA